jgi:hypothetical protein
MADHNAPDGYAPFDLYPYNPAVAPAYAFCALFGIAALVHVATMFPYRIWFPLPLAFGCCSKYTTFPCKAS